MARATYRRGEAYAATVRELVRSSACPERDWTLDHYHLALVQAVRTTLTWLEIKTLYSYYVRRMGMVDIAQEAEVNVSTVSRNLSRAEGKLDALINLAREISPVKFPAGK